MSSSAVALPEEKTKELTERDPLYNLVLFDDDSHSYEYVIKMMVDLFSMSQEDAFQVAYNVDYNGEAIVKTCGLEEALIGRERIMTYGPDPAVAESSGSMVAAVFEAD
ncbi:MAG: ATP-dependent Clp protease adaptor ClpS [Candidatus Sumerlaeia bacterium]|nr:ATP-dependent Clp protease adaptor ClpS [Candidatus Sumerlaeia bacterium]